MEYELNKLTKFDAFPCIEVPPLHTDGSLKRPLINGSISIGDPVSVVRAFNNLRGNRNVSFFNVLTQAFRSKERPRVLRVGSGVSNLLIPQGTCVLDSVIDCLAGVAQYTLPNGEINLRVFHKMAIEGFSIQFIADILECVRADNPKEISLALCGNGVTSASATLAPVLPRAEDTYRQLVSSILPEARITSIQLHFGPDSINTTHIPVYYLAASTIKMGDIASYSLQQNRQGVENTLRAIAIERLQAYR